MNVMGHPDITPDDLRHAGDLLRAHGADKAAVAVGDYLQRCADGGMRIIPGDDPDYPVVTYDPV